MYEYEIEALVAYGFRRYHGTEAFPTIVASGPNACILHYTKNTRQLQEGDLILLDFGMELDGYGADISRTFPVGGIFSPRQQELYNAVLDVKQFAESILKP
jgi:Xaa-Pro aminopeptidase